MPAPFSCQIKSPTSSSSETKTCIRKRGKEQDQQPGEEGTAACFSRLRDDQSYKPSIPSVANTSRLPHELTHRTSAQGTPKQAKIPWALHTNSRNTHVPQGTCNFILTGVLHAPAKDQCRALYEGPSRLLLQTLERIIF